MNSWNSKQFHEMYDSQVLGFLTRVSPDEVNSNSPVLAHAIRELVASEILDPNQPETLNRAK